LNIEAEKTAWPNPNLECGGLAPLWPLLRMGYLTYERQPATEAHPSRLFGGQSAARPGLAPLWPLLRMGYLTYERQPVTEAHPSRLFGGKALPGQAWAALAFAAHGVSHV